MKRPSWDEYFMGIARQAATRSTCLRRQIGALLVYNRAIIGTGYNGAPSRTKHCDVIGCIRDKEKIASGTQHEKCKAVHAEQNALLQCAKNGVSTNGSTIYTTTYPCSICAKMIINAGIMVVIYDGDYPDPAAKELFKEAGITVRRIDE